MQNNKFLITLIIPFVIIVIFLSYFLYATKEGQEERAVNNNIQTSKPTEQKYSQVGVFTDTGISLIDKAKVLQGVPGSDIKDRIPAIDNPEFTSLAKAQNNTNLTPETLGILVQIENEARFYPYNIMVWHEIVNDEIADIPIAVTFCPLCGSAIVYSRQVGDVVLDFGVSGLLYESNLLMYDRDTESLWSQIEGRSVIGHFAKQEAELILLDAQVVEFGSLDRLDSAINLSILAEPKDSNRNYSIYPYGDYDENNENFIFPVTYKGEDIGLPAKQIMYAARSSQPVAFAYTDLIEVGRAELNLDDGTKLSAEYLSNGQVSIKVIPEDPLADAYELPGYFTMWFSWANHNLDSGVNSEASGVFWQN